MSTVPVSNSNSSASYSEQSKKSSRDHKITTGVNTVDRDDIINIVEDYNNHEPQQHHQDVVSNHDENTRMVEGADLLREVVDGSEIAPTIQDINFEDEFERMVQEVEQEGLAEQSETIFHEEHQQQNIPPATPTRAPINEQRTSPRQRGNSSVAGNNVACQATGVTEQVENQQQQSGETPYIHQRYNLNVPKEIEDWKNGEGMGPNGAANEEDGGVNDQNNEDNDDEYETSYTIDDIINF